MTLLKKLIWFDFKEEKKSKYKTRIEQVFYIDGNTVEGKNRYQLVSRKKREKVGSKLGNESNELELKVVSFLYVNIILIHVSTVKEKISKWS